MRRSSEPRVQRVRSVVSLSRSPLVSLTDIMQAYPWHQWVGRLCRSLRLPFPLIGPAPSNDAFSGNARALADEGHVPPRAPGSIDPALANSVPGTPSSLQPPSPNLASRRISITPGGTTKVLADLQTGVINARNALENTKAQLRLSQRSVAQLTRQTEDLKEGRERLRLENEGLNNVVARKERLLQEVCNSFVHLVFILFLLSMRFPDRLFLLRFDQVLERARKAETEAASLKTQLKAETINNKKSIRDMEAALSESTALSQKSEREYITLRDSLKSMTESWKQDIERLRDEMRKKEE